MNWVFQYYNYNNTAPAPSCLVIRKYMGTWAYGKPSEKSHKAHISYTVLKFAK